MVFEWFLSGSRTTFVVDCFLGGFERKEDGESRGCNCVAGIMGSESGLWRLEVCERISWHITCIRHPGPRVWCTGGVETGDDALMLKQPRRCPELIELRVLCQRAIYF